ncbi:MAG: CrcB family protein [Bacteroides sp.]|nr:CrcB family protein [Bacteroidales bacterium]MBD5316773.1 CrcB family protein [Bacteroides sp.]MBD5378245.1 CrcB family protein [Bacteroides sp.]
MALITDIVMVGLGGALGALSRFGVEHLGFFDNDKYYYTVAINLTGCMVIGILWALFQHFGVARIWYLFCITGFLGGYTTYSAFTLDAITQWQGGRPDITLLYIAITLVGGLGGCALGLIGTEKILKMIG